MKILSIFALIPCLCLGQISVQKTGNGVVSNGPVGFGSGNTLSATTGATVNFTGATQIGIVAGSASWSGLTGIPSPTFSATKDGTFAPTLLASGGATAALTVTGINGTALSGLSTGLLYNTTTTGVPAITTFSGGSLAFTAPNLTLSGDSASPGNSYFYGTNPSGTKGWYALTSGAVTSISGTANQITASASTGAVTVSLAGPHAFTTQTANNIITGNSTSALQSSGATITGSGNVLTFAGGSTLTDASGSVTLASSPTLSTLLLNSSGASLLSVEGTGDLFTVNAHMTSNAQETFGIRSTFTLNTVDDPTNHHAAILGEVLIAAGNAAVFGQQIAASYNYVHDDGSGTVAEGVNTWAVTKLNNSATHTTHESFSDVVGLTGTSHIGTLYHIKVNAATIADTASVGTEYGIYIGNLTVATTKYGIYQAGSQPNFFTGATTFQNGITSNSGQILNDGSVGAPGFATQSNPNMGMYRASNNVLGWAVGGVQQVSLSTSALTLANNDLAFGGGSTITDSSGAITATSAVNKNLKLSTSGTGTVSISSPSGAPAVTVTSTNGTQNTIQIMRYAPPPGWDIATIIGPQGEIKTNASILISGTSDFQYPTGTATMFGVLSDVDGPVIVSRGNAQPNSYLFLGMNEFGGYSYAIDLNGALHWGVGVDKGSMDTDLYRLSAGVLKTDGAFTIGNGLNVATISALTSTGDITMYAGTAGQFTLVHGATAADAYLDLTALTKTGTAVNSAAIIAKSIGLSGNLWVNTNINLPTSGTGLSFLNGTSTITAVTAGTITVSQPGNTAFSIANGSMTGTNPMLTLTTTGADVPIAMRFVTSSTHNSWMVAAQTNVSNALEITPSTTAGGTTFSTPVVTVGLTGLSVTGILSATGHTTFEGVTSTGATGSAKLVYSASPTFTGTITAAIANYSGNVSTTGSAQFQSDGSVGSPGFSTASNTNMGMYRVSNNVLGFAVGGAQQVSLSSTVLTASGNVTVNGATGISVGTAGATIAITSGTNAASGTVTLAAGTGTITSTAITANSVIFFSEKTAGGTPGLYQPLAAVSAGSATVTSAATDTSTYNWVALLVQ